MKESRWILCCTRDHMDHGFHGRKKNIPIYELTRIPTANEVKEHTRSVNMKKTVNLLAPARIYCGRIEILILPVTFYGNLATPRLRALLHLVHAHKKNMDYSKPGESARPRNSPRGPLRSTCDEFLMSLSMSIPRKSMDVNDAKRVTLLYISR